MSSLVYGGHEYFETAKRTLEACIDADVIELFLPFSAGGDEGECALWRPHSKCRDGVQSSQQRPKTEIVFRQVEIANREANLH